MNAIDDNETLDSQAADWAASEAQTRSFEQISQVPPPRGYLECINADGVWGLAASQESLSGALVTALTATATQYDTEPADSSAEGYASAGGVSFALHNLDRCGDALFAALGSVRVEQSAGIALTRLATVVSDGFSQDNSGSLVRACVRSNGTRKTSTTTDAHSVQYSQYHPVCRYDHAHVNIRVTVNRNGCAQNELIVQNKAALICYPATCRVRHGGVVTETVGRVGDGVAAIPTQARLDTQQGNLRVSQFVGPDGYPSIGGTRPLQTLPTGVHEFRSTTEIQRNRPFTTIGNDNFSWTQIAEAMGTTVAAAPKRVIDGARQYGAGISLACTWR